MWIGIFPKYLRFPLFILAAETYFFARNITHKFMKLRSGPELLIAVIHKQHF